MPEANDSPSSYELEMLSRKIGNNWVPLAFRLRFDQGAVDGFDSNNSRLADKARDMLFKWKQRDGSGATYRVLREALSHELVGCRELAQDLASGRFAEARKDDEAELQLNLC